jgi:hypothetical protein
MSDKFQIVIEFPNKEMADEFCGQMSDGFGEGLVHFSHWKQLPNTDGKKPEHFIKVYDEKGRPVFFVDEIYEDF